MSPDPVGGQARLIDSTEGIYLVDAGAGTGKTFTITRRYANLLDSGVEPGEIFLATFTENAADNMKEEIINHCDRDVSELRDAPISTFHGFCQRLILSDGFDVPQRLGIDERITGNTKTLSNQVREENEFAAFYDRFVQDHPEYSSFYPLIYDEADLLELIKSLGAKGIFPTSEGWYGSGADLLLGDEGRFFELSKEANEPLPGKRGPKNSWLLNRMNMRNKTFLQGVREKGEIQSGKQVDPSVLRWAFSEDREGLVNFVHDLYLGYIEYALGKNYINFSLQLTFAFVLLMEDDGLRRQKQFDYVMVDEFQDTNELQFKLSLLLSGTGNIAVVGDWKQSIYGFQYASVKNINEFHDRIRRYHGEINDDRRRVTYDIDGIEEIELTDNFRSSQVILDRSEGALEVRGKKKEVVELDRGITPLTSRVDRRPTEVRKFTSNDEVDAVLEKLVEVVEGEKYRLEKRRINYGDVAILSRNRSFAQQLDKRARELKIPVSFEGGAEIFKADPGIILLAWLRILEDEKSKRGWSVVLDEAGYNIVEVKKMIGAADYPPDAVEFKSRLAGAYDVGEIARTVFNRYGYDNPFTDAIIEVLQETFAASYLNLGEIVRFIEDNVERGSTYEVDSARKDAATVQTIHAAKGLEYPVVFLANVNRGNFPSTNSGGSRIYYDDVVGLRQSKVYSEEEDFVLDNFPAFVVSKVKGVDYDEERRLLYVAMTRAQSYLYVFAETGKESTFFEDLDLETEEIVPDLEELPPQYEGGKSLEVRSPEEKRPIKRYVHSVIDFPGQLEKREGRGPEFGTQIHLYAEEVARGIEVSPPEGEKPPDRKNLYEFIGSLEGEIHPEQEVVIPECGGGKKTVYHGSIDLLHVKENRVEVIDFKTDLDRDLEGEYRKQLNLYKRAAAAEYPDREVVGIIYYTATGEAVEV